MKPFLKYLGRKYDVAARLSELMPESIDRYFEPFVGSAAMYLYLKSTGRIDYAMLSDNNYQLMSVYYCMRDKAMFGLMMKYLRYHQEHHSRAYYHQIRKYTFTSIEKLAARYLYINRTAFSGLMRQNSAGWFNAPLKKEPPSWLPDARYNNARILLQSAEMKTFDYSVLTNYLKPGDFVYFDPPYNTTSTSEDNRIYGSMIFDIRQQYNLKLFCDWCTENSVLFLQTNSPCESIQLMYGEYNIKLFPVRYNVNGKHQDSSCVNDLVITNY
ncbi:MAG: DNA adenine methylase [Waterburya sp.]